VPFDLHADRIGSAHPADGVSATADAAVVIWLYGRRASGRDGARRHGYVARCADVYFEERQVGLVQNFQFGQLGHSPGGS
jgi:hypothetical protein